MKKHSTIKTADDFNIPLKTVENWITAFNKDNHCFDQDYLTSAKQIQILKRKVYDLEKSNDILKKTITMLAKKD